MMDNRTSDCALLIMLAITILFFVGSKMMINDCLDQLNEYRMENQIENHMSEIMDIQPFCYETVA